MIREIVKDTEFLSKPAEAATAEDAAVAQDLVDTMESMKDDCACLAANQIGSTKAVIAFDDNGTTCVMYNPKVKQAMRPYGAVFLASLPPAPRTRDIRRAVRFLAVPPAR